ncbi:MAG: IS4 family transposase, partial [Candidatus Desantisbacteria bacterium]
MSIISKVANVMQSVLTYTADAIARKTGFIKRLRKLTGSGFVQTLVFGWLSNPTATLEELTQTAASLGISITPQGLDKRFTQKAANFIKKVLESAVATVIAQKPVAIPVLQRFSSVYIQDSSTITLPDSLAVIYHGCGGSTVKNTSSAVKTQIRLNLNTGELLGPYLQSGKEHDQSSQLAEIPLPKGALRIADLGYFSLSDFKDLNSQEVYWLSRVKSQCDVYYDGKRFSLLEFLEKQCQDQIDLQVLLGVKEQVDCRLLAVKVPDEVAKIRRCKLLKEAQRKGKKASDRALKLARFLIMSCNIPCELLSISEAFVL